MVAHAPTPQLAHAGRRDPAQADGLRLLLRRDAASQRAPGGQIRGGFWVERPAADCSPSRATTAAPARTCTTPATTTAPSTPSRAWRPTSASRRPDPAAALLRHLPHVPRRQLRLRPGPRPSRSATWKTYLGVRVFEGALPYRGMRRRPDLGRQHVRGADGPAVRARGEVGPADLGRQPPALRRAARSSTAWTRRSTATGASRRRRPGRRLPRVRRRRARHGARPATPPTRSSTLVDQPLRRLPRGASRRPRPSYGDGVVTPHASFLALPLRAATPRWPTWPSCATNFDAYGPGGFYDAVAVAQRQGRQALPVPRPGHGHGRARQRAGRRRHAPLRSQGRDAGQAPPLMRQEVFSAGVR